MKTLSCRLLLCLLFQLVTVISKGQELTSFIEIWGLRDKHVSYVTSHLLKKGWTAIKEGQDIENKDNFKLFSYKEDAALEVRWYSEMEYSVYRISYNSPNRKLYGSAMEWIRKNCKFVKSEAGTHAQGPSTYDHYMYGEGLKATMITVITYLTENGEMLSYGYSIMF